PTSATREFDSLVARIARPGDYVAAENRPARPVNPPEAAPPAVERLKERGGRLTLGDRQVHFATAQSALPHNAEGALSDIAKAMKDNPGWTIRIEGYTDNVGKDDANRALSQARAESVMKWLQDHGVDQGRMTARGYGETRPTADNSSEDGRARNRRV